MRMFMVELLVILWLINPVAGLLALAVVAVLAAIYYAAKLIIALAASLIESLVVAMIAAAVIVATVIMAIVASVVAMVVATAQFIGNVPTYVSEVCSYFVQSVGGAAYFVASF
ncbi:MAG TPA: hypothetical protein DDY37_01580, partial [Legionella sp.]|nr:hypothetical protein [Legionella sp.]